jgi:putative MATE family efflux protein
MFTRTSSPGENAAIDRSIWTVAAPAMGGFLGVILFDIVDIFWIARLGPDAMAGVASASFIVWTIYAVMQTTCSGCNSLVAQAFGAKDEATAHRVTVEASWLSLFLSLGLVALCLVGLERPFAWMGLSAITTQYALEYFRIMVWGIPVLFLYVLSGHIFNAYGETRTSNLIMGVALVFNLVLDPVLMFGWLGFPKFGIGGASLATIFSQVIGLCLRWYWLRKMRFIPALAEFARPFPLRHSRRILVIGLPNALTNLLWSLVYPALTKLITPFGMAPLSGMGLCHRLESFPYFAGVGMGVAMSTLVGQAVGRGDFAEVGNIVRRGHYLISWIMVPFALVFLVFPASILTFFTDHPETIRNGAEYLFVIGICELFLGWEMAFSGVFTGLGRTLPTLWITVPFTLGRIPLGWLLGHYLGFGSIGIWWAISLSTFGKGVGLFLLFRLLYRKQALEK